MKKIINSKGFRNIVFLMQTILTALLTYLIYDLNLLPTKELIILVGILLLVLILMGIWLFKSKPKSKSSAVAKLFSLLISIALILGSFSLYKGIDFLNMAFNANKKTHVTHAVVLKDSPYQNMDDVKDKVFGANTTQDKKNIDNAIEEINKKYNYNPNIENYSDYEGLNYALYSENVDVILMGESHRAFMEEINPNFDNETRIIGTFTYEEVIENDGKDVNVTEETFSIFVSGIDTYGPVSTVSRSDVNMIITVNPKTRQILLTSIPRDYHVILPSFNAYDKLTHAGIYGVDESIGALENLLDIQIDYYLKVNFSSVETLVDALGGVEVYSQYTFVTRHGQYQIVSGMNYLNGSQSLGFVRERYSLPNGDSDRVRNQQELIKGVLNKMLSPAIITNYTGILNSMAGLMELSMPSDQFKDLVKHQIDDNTTWEILQVQLTGTGSKSTTTYSMPGWNLYVMEPNYQSVDYVSGLIHAMENNEVITVQQP